jgi:hypothetical protein
MPFPKKIQEYSRLFRALNDLINNDGYQFILELTSASYTCPSINLAMMYYQAETLSIPIILSFQPEAKVSFQKAHTNFKLTTREFNCTETKTALSTLRKTSQGDIFLHPTVNFSLPITDTYGT